MATAVQQRVKSMREVARMFAGMAANATKALRGDIESRNHFRGMRDAWSVAARAIRVDIQRIERREREKERQRNAPRKRR